MGMWTKGLWEGAHGQVHTWFGPADEATIFAVDRAQLVLKSGIRPAHVVLSFQLIWYYQSSSCSAMPRPYLPIPPSEGRRAFLEMGFGALMPHLDTLREDLVQLQKHYLAKLSIRKPASRFPRKPGLLNLLLAYRKRYSYASARIESPYAPAQGTSHYH